MTLISSIAYPLVLEIGLKNKDAVLIASMLGEIAAFLLILPVVYSSSLRKLFKIEKAVKRGIALYLLCTFVMIFGGLLISAFFEVKYEPVFEEVSPIYAVAMLLLTAPVVEELIFRGLILHGLRDYAGDIIATVFSSLFFALLHYSSTPVLLLPVVFLDGFLLSYFVLKWRNLVPLIIAHTLINLQALLFYWLI
ncbi:MAG: hypothetical protein DRJ38_01420 [Thermoprotei archaeon]|nr:MAG: hypothetical protein DRJ38_01420 [Thermoprotei archaeon]